MKEPLALATLFPEIDLIRDANLRAAVVKIWERLWEQSEYERVGDVPVSLKIPYPQVKHAQGVVRAALATADVFEAVHGRKFDRDVLIAGALLMDVSKLVETRPSGAGYAATELGRRLPHATIAAHLALELGVSLAVVHVITAHSPNGGKAPSTPECQLLDWLDQADISAAGHEIWARKVNHFQP